MKEFLENQNYSRWRLVVSDSWSIKRFFYFFCSESPLFSKSQLEIPFFFHSLDFSMKENLHFILFSTSDSLLVTFQVSRLLGQTKEQKNFKTRD